ncbi:hypothetical protein SB00175_03704 [Klebsiella oxytoca]|nr:hypothetical protein SB00175_03704 [Klebsiella oxytoca]
MLSAWLLISFSVCVTRLDNAFKAVASAFFVTFALVPDRSFCSFVIAWLWLASVLPCSVTFDDKSFTTLASALPATPFDENTTT